MDLNSLFYSLGLSGLFTSRAFLPAFCTALFLRYGEGIPGLGKIEFLQAIGNEPHWFTHGGVIAALGILSLVELAADKSPEAREVLDEVSVYAKTGVSTLTTLGILSASDGQFIEGMTGPQAAGFFDILPALGSGTLTYFLSRARSGVLGVLSEADDDDSLGIRSFISWCEEIWATLGVYLLLIYTLTALGLIGLAMGAILLLRWRFEKKQEAAKIECPSCQHRVHAFATGCHQCGYALEAPRKLGFLGRVSDEANSDIEEQKLRLLEMKRSPLSGEKAEGRSVDIVCEADNVKLFGDKALTGKYLQRVSARLPKVLLVGALLSLVPLLGLIIGVIYYRFQLVAPFRRYLSWSKGLFARLLIWIFFLALISFQWVPVAGALVVPIMALVNYVFYRSAFVSALQKADLAP